MKSLNSFMEFFVLFMCVFLELFAKLRHSLKYSFFDLISDLFLGITENLWIQLSRKSLGNPHTKN
jgi:hypothetical protein